MERSEPTLVPEWLRNGGSPTGGSSASHSVGHAASNLARDKSVVLSNGHDLRRSSSSDRTTLSHFQRSSSSNGSGRLSSYSSFGKNQWAKVRDRDIYDSHDEEKPLSGDYRHRDFSDVFGNILPSKFERDKLNISQSMISGKRGETWPKKVVTDLSSASRNNNGLLTGGSPVGIANKSAFDINFPSLGAEERPAPSEVGRVPSPVLGTAIRSLPIGSATVIGGEKWTSALAEVPMSVGNDGIGISSLHQSTSSKSSSSTLGTSSGLNMAETVAQSSTNTQITTQSSSGTPRHEELAIKQSRQLIPVTLSMSKTLVPNSSDKRKNNIGKQHTLASPLPVSHSPRGVPEKSDFSKTSNVGKLHVLKAVREKNGLSPKSPYAKDNSSPTSGSKILNSTPVVPGSGSAANRSLPQNPIPASANCKPVLTVLEKKPTSKSRSRNDFFNLVRKKSLQNSTPVPDPSVENPSAAQDPSMANSSKVSDHEIISLSVSDKLGELQEVVASNTHAGRASSSVGLSVSHLSIGRGDLTCDSDACNGQKYVSNGNKSLSMDPVFPEEEEVALLRSMGWEENADEGGLTEEEISAFYRDIKSMNPRPSLKILRVLPQFLSSLDSQIETGDGISSGLCSSDTNDES